jgi:WD40 repeat protein
MQILTLSICLVAGVLLQDPVRPDAGGSGRGQVDSLGDPLPEGATARIGSLRFWSVKPASSIAFSPDGKTVTAVASGYSGDLRIWDAASGRVVRTLRRPQRRDPDTGGMHWVAFSPDGKTLAVAGTEGTIDLWDVPSWRITRTLAGHEGVVRRVVFAPDGKGLATGGDDGTVRLWDLMSGAIRRLPVPVPEKSVRCLAFSPDGRTLASGSNEPVIRLWDTASGKEVRRISHQNQKIITDVAFTRDGRNIAGAG